MISIVVRLDKDVFLYGFINGFIQYHDEPQEIYAAVAPPNNIELYGREFTMKEIISEDLHDTILPSVPIHSIPMDEIGESDSVLRDHSDDFRYVRRNFKKLAEDVFGKEINIDERSWFTQKRDLFSDVLGNDPNEDLRLAEHLKIGFMLLII